MERNILEKLIVFALNFVGWIWGIVTFLPWYYLSGKKMARPLQRVQAKPISREPGAPYRSIDHFNGLVTTLYEGVYTLDGLFRRSVELYGSRRCLGVREFVSEEEEVQPNGRVFKKLVLGKYHWQTYSEVSKRVENFGSGLSVIGQKPKQNVVIFAETRAEWTICAHACFARNIPVVTLYATLGDEAIVHGIKQTEVSLIITDCHLLAKLKNVAHELDAIQHIVYIGEAAKKDTMGFPESMKVHSMAEIEQLGEQTPHPPSKVTTQPGDTAVIMYTSGSTGLPKGVIFSHFNLVSTISAGSSRIPNLGCNDVYVGYLPLAHVLELVAENTMLAYGASIGYSSPLTLSDQSSKIKKGTQGDVSVLKPTLMAAVPVIMDRIRQNVLDKIREGPRPLQVFFNFAYNYKLQQIKRGYDAPLLNRIVFAKIRNLLGGNVREMLSGGAPLSEDTQYFMNVCFCCPVIQGYGLTETSGGSTICNYWDRTTGRVGPPISCCQIKLVDWEEGGYKNTDKPNPRGEVVVGGHNITMGYFKNPEKTAEDFVVDENGLRWFHTGDIGEFHADGCLKIIDRKKDLVKLQFGEYVSLGKVEAALTQSNYVETVCVYADSLKTYPVCLVVPRPKQLKELAKSLNLNPEDRDALCDNEDVKNEIMKSLEAAAKTGKLEKFEVPKKLKICKEVWTPESDLVTAALKLKRKNISKYYQADLQAMYSS